MTRTISLSIFTLLAAGACSKRSGDGAGKSETGETETGETTEAPGPTEPGPAEMTRLFACDFVAWSGEGPERQGKFALANKSDRSVKRVQTWIYYYKGGEQFDRYPHALAQSFEPGVKTELELGAKGDKIKKETSAAACEITEATFTDGESWSNHNLNYNRLMIPRPLDGETHEQLLARTGEKVKARWTGNQEGKARFELENASGQPLEVRTAWVYYYDVDGRQLARAVSGLMQKLAVGATAEAELGYERDKIPEGAAVIEAGVSSVEFEGGRTWINRNLAPFERPMVSKPQAAPEPDAGN